MGSFGVFESLNSPPLVASAGAVAVACLPSLEHACVTSRLSWPAIQVANGLAYGLNLYATSQPGRIDGVQQQSTKKGVVDARTRRGRTLLVPAGWAFSIWAPIFAGELVFCLATLVLAESAPIAAVVKQASAGFMISQIFQALWSAAFRPKYDTGKRILVSGFMLSGIALSLSRAHAAYSTAATVIGLGDYLIYFLPMTLHFGWTTAAALVNWNGNLASLTDDKRVLAWAGHLSAVAAGIVGVAVTVTRRAPVFGGVIAWALAGCADGIKSRMVKAESLRRKKRRKSVDEAPAGIYGAKVQQWLCTAGAVLSGAAALFVTLHSHDR